MTAEIHLADREKEVFKSSVRLLYNVSSFNCSPTNNKHGVHLLCSQEPQRHFSAFSTLCFLMCLSAKKLLVEFHSFCLLLTSPTSFSPFTAARQAKDFLVLLDSRIVVVRFLQRGFSKSHHSLSLHLLLMLDIGSLFRALIGCMREFRRFEHHLLTNPPV